MKTHAMIAIGLLMLAGTAMAGTQKPAGQAAPAEATPAGATQVASADADSQTHDTEIRCKRMTVTGSRLGKRVCHTGEEWAQMERSADDLMRDIQASPMPFVDGQSKTGAQPPQSTFDPP